MSVPKDLEVKSPDTLYGTRHHQHQNKYREVTRNSRYGSPTQLPNSWRRVAREIVQQLCFQFCYITKCLDRIEVQIMRVDVQNSEKTYNPPNFPMKNDGFA